MAIPSAQLFFMIFLYRIVVRTKMQYSSRYEKYYMVPCRKILVNVPNNDASVFKS